MNSQYTAMPYTESIENAKVRKEQKEKARQVKYPVYRYFQYSDLPEGLQTVSRLCHSLALIMIDELPDSEEKSEGLRKLLEARDCFVRANLGINK